MKQLIKRITKDQWVSLLLLLAVLFFGGLTGYIYGYENGTGTFPFAGDTKSIIPPGVDAVSSDTVDTFVADDDTHLEEYDVGFNCVEYAFLVARNARWQGISAAVVRLVFADGTAHMIIGFPTEDVGWRFLQIEGSTWIYPRVGGMFADKEIVGLYYLSDFVWEPIEREVNR